jgi:hypothetical protein
MRLAIRLAAMASIFMLGGAVVASTTSAPQAVNATEAPAETYAILNTTGMAEGHDSEVADCVRNAPGHLPDGTDAASFCRCAIDSITTGSMSQPDAIVHWATELRLPIAGIRTSQISECAAYATDHLPGGTDVNAFCSCAVDRMIASQTPQQDAIGQCAAELHITLPAADDDPGTNAMAGNRVD